MDQINFNLGDQLELFHAEPHRLKSAEKTLLSGEKLNSFTITSLGLQNNKNCNNPATDLNNRLEAAAQEIIKNPQWINCKYMPLKDEIYLAIKNYPEPERSRLLDKYKEVIPGDNQSPGEYVGNVFNMNLLGISDRMFFSVNIDRIDNTITFESKKGEPHYRFENTSYAVIRYVNSMGIEQYSWIF